MDHCSILVAHFEGQAPWVRHPGGDELIVVLDGGGHVTVLTEDSPVRSELRPGMLFVCPKGLWHKSVADPAMTAFYVTPLTKYPMVPAMTVIATRSRGAKVFMEFYWDTVEENPTPRQILDAIVVNTPPIVHALLKAVLLVGCAATSPQVVLNASYEPRVFAFGGRDWKVGYVQPAGACATSIRPWSPPQLFLVRLPRQKPGRRLRRPLVHRCGRFQNAHSWSSAGRR